eukprot:TRINITY_DN529_c0_g1_i1.p1 TRINITY_DN529_c0_g1~~TRINITY_DN529_c0_g1_i1.p1  ORF type:complete len:252 (-),score=63.36 TRINITY_DN529_c0_g1_i1:277-1002(-)
MMHTRALVLMFCCFILCSVSKRQDGPPKATSERILSDLNEAVGRKCCTQCSPIKMTLLSGLFNFLSSRAACVLLRGISLSVPKANYQQKIVGIQVFKRQIPEAKFMDPLYKCGSFPAPLHYFVILSTPTNKYLYERGPKVAFKLLSEVALATLTKDAAYVVEYFPKHIMPGATISTVVGVITHTGRVGYNAVRNNCQKEANTIVANLIQDYVPVITQDSEFEVEVFDALKKYCKETCKKRF